MNLEELKLQVQNDLRVNDEHLDTESLKNQEIKAKYLEHKSRFELLLFKAKGDYKRLYREKWEYYGGKADAKVYASKPFDLKVLKTDLSVYITSDEEVIDAENKIGYLETVFDAVGLFAVVFLKELNCVLFFGNPIPINQLCIVI